MKYPAPESTVEALFNYPNQLRTFEYILELFDKEDEDFDIELSEVIHSPSNLIEEVSWKVTIKGKPGILYLVRLGYSSLKFWFHYPLKDENSSESDYWDLAELIPNRKEDLFNHHQIVLNFL